MKFKISLSVAFTIPTSCFVLFTATLPSFGSESYLSSDLKCSMRCERVRATLAPQQEITNNSEFFVENADQAGDEYKDIVNKINNQKYWMQIGLDNFELSTKVMASTVEWVPGIGGMVEYGTGKVLEAFKNTTADELDDLIRSELEKVKREDDDPNLDKFDALSAQDRARKLLTAPNSLFNRLTPEARDYVQNIMIEELGKKFDQIKIRVLKNQSALEQAIVRIGELEAQYAKQEAVNVRISDALKRYQATFQTQNKNAAASTDDNPVKNEKAVGDAQKREMLLMASEMKDASEQAQAAARVLLRVGREDLAKGATFMAGFMQFVSGIGLSYANSSAILPTIEMGLKLFGGGGFGGSSNEQQAIAMQKAILEALNEMERRNQLRYTDIVDKLGDIKGNVIFNTKQLDQLIEGDLPMCSSVIPQGQTPTERIGFFANYGSLKSFIETMAGASIQPCLTALRKHFGDAPEISMVFKLSPAQIEEALKETMVKPIIIDRPVRSDRAKRFHDIRGVS